MPRFNIYEAPELQWLRSPDVSTTPEGDDAADKEYKRTLASIRLFENVLEGDYQSFTACQDTGKLTEKSFNAMREYIGISLPTEEDRYAMEVFLLINDLGKIGSFREKIENADSVSSFDHDLMMYEGLSKYPELSPTFNALGNISSIYQRKILNGMRTNFNLAQFIQCECLPANLEGVKGLSMASFNFYAIHFLLDVAGAAGHVIENGTPIVNEQYWKKFWAAINTLIIYINGSNDASGTYKDYIAHTNKMYAASDYPYPVMKLCNTMRLADTDEAAVLNDAFAQLDGNIRTTLNEELSYQGIESKGEEQPAILLYYLPAMLQNGMSYYAETMGKADAIAKTVEVLFPVLADIYTVVRENMPASAGGTVVTSFIDDVAQAAKQPDNIDIRSNFDIVVNNETECKFQRKDA